MARWFLDFVIKVFYSRCKVPTLHTGDNMIDDQQRLRNLQKLHDSLSFALEDVKKEIKYIMLRHSAAPDSFSEEKEKFIAP